MTQYVCAHCEQAASGRTGTVNRAIKQRKPLYCNRRCFGLARRKHRTKAELIERKRIYDADYRVKNRTMLKAKKAAYFQRTYDPAKAAVARKVRMPSHVEYCRRPAYKTWKREYDRRYRARYYGDFAECHMLLICLEAEVASRMTKYEIRLANNTLNKAFKRRREYEGLTS